MKRVKIDLAGLSVQSFVTSPARDRLRGGSFTISLVAGVACNGTVGGGGVSDESMCCPAQND